MPIIRSGGLGFEALGDPFGAGGPLHVVRALAVEGQTVRVVFDEEPLHVGGAAQNDALNPGNYTVEILTGEGQDPVVVGVKPAMVTGPVYGVLMGDERAFDIQTDRQLVTGLVYEVTAANIKSKLGMGLGFPYSATFPGVVPVKSTLRPTRQLENMDLANTPVLGAFTVDDSGDVAPHGGSEGLRKRVVRRLVTPKGAFAFLPTYGVGLRLKNPASSRELVQFQADVVQQLSEEPEVATVNVKLSHNGNGVLTVQTQIKTRTGLALEVTAQNTGNGIVIT
jgi:hypothetical protein